MMNWMNECAGGLMWGSVLFEFLTIIVLVLAIAAFVKHFFFGRRGNARNG
jgi:hypothetical protein